MQSLIELQTCFFCCNSISNGARLCSATLIVFNHQRWLSLTAMEVVFYCQWWLSFTVIWVVFDQQQWSSLMAIGVVI